MKKKKTNKKIASALAMLMLSAAMLGTSTYAWFTMSRTVKVDGMEVKTKVSGNLLISDTNQSDAYYGTELTQGIKALLEPTSTATALDDAFYYTVDANADGSKLHAPSSANYQYKSYNETTTALDATFSKKENYDATFNSTYSITPAATEFGTAYGYIDYVFYLKATADSTYNQIKMTTCNLSYNNLGIVGTEKAWRVAVFATETAAGTTSATPVTTGNLKGSILTLTGATNHNSGKAVIGQSGTDTQVYGTVAYNNAGVVIDTIDTTNGSVTKYYKVDVRLWLEGQDTTCTSETYAALSNSWKLDLKFELDNTATAVTAITTAAPNTVTDDVPRPVGN